MKISTLLAAGALALMCMLGASAAAAASLDVTTEPILSYEDIAYPAVCEVLDVNAEAAALPMVECSSPAMVRTSTDSFTIATLIAPASIYDLPIYVHFDPGRVADAVG
jgi:hypothetical protein